LIDDLYLHLISGIAFLVGSIVLGYFSTKSKGSIKGLAIIFLVFTIIHSFYHVTSYLNLEILAEGFLEPLSVIILIFFGFSYLIIKSKLEVKPI